MGRPRPTRSHAPPKEMGRPRPTRSQPPRSARYLTNGPRAGHLPALPRTCDALVPHDHMLPPGGGTPSSHTITCSPQGRGTPPSHTITTTALRALLNKWPEGGPSPRSPKDVRRPRPTRSQPPRSARYLTNGPRAGHLPALPRTCDALVPHDHMLPPGGGTPPSHTITCFPQGDGTPSSHTFTATALCAPLNKWPEGGPSPCSPKDVRRPRPTRSHAPPRRWDALVPHDHMLPPRRWDALVPHVHSHRAPRAT